MKKHVIWSNTDLDIKDWKDGYKEWLEINHINDRDPNDEDDIYDWMVETNNNYLDDERMNLDQRLDGRILVFGSLGLWDGRHQGYKIINSRNLNSILNFEYEYFEIYGDGHNIKATEIHHDGTNYYEYRVIREDRNIDNLLDAILKGEEISRSKLNYYTKSLYKDVAEIYGWR